MSSTIIWDVPAEPLKVLFDTPSGDITYDIYLHDSPDTDTGWSPHGGVNLESRAWKRGPLETRDICGNTPHSRICEASILALSRRHPA